MKLVILLSMVATAVLAETYTPENDNLDIEAVVSNDDTLSAFQACFVDKGPCDAVQADFKNDLPEAVQQACAKCTDAQKHLAKRLLEVLKEKQPDKYQEIRNKYDPENKFFQSFETAISPA